GHRRGRHDQRLADGRGVRGAAPAPAGVGRAVAPVRLHRQRRTDHGLPAAVHPLRRPHCALPHPGATRPVRPVAPRPDLLQGLALQLLIRPYPHKGVHMYPSTRRRLVALTAATGLALSACTAVDDDPESTTTEDSAVGYDTDTDTETATDGAPADDGAATGDAAGEITIGDGVTEEPCPDGVNPDNGCIYLGVLSDLTEGPFAALAVPITDAQRNYWAQVNEDGGIAGFDVDIDTYTRDTKY